MTILLSMPTKLNDKNDFLIPLGKRLTLLRKDRGLTQTDIANEIGTSQQGYAAYEKGIKRVTVSKLPKLANCLNITIDELLGISTTTKKPGPIPKLNKKIEAVKKLPNNKQKLVLDFLDTVIQSSLV